MINFPNYTPASPTACAVSGSSFGEIWGRRARNLVRDARGHAVRWLTAGFRSYSHLYYVIEPTDWSIAWDGRYITRGVRQSTGVPAHVVRSPLGLRNQIVHFGSRNLYLLGGYRDVEPTNRVVMTWFHGHPDDPTEDNRAMIAALPDRARELRFVVTTSTIARSRLSKWGVPPEKIVVIPLGVDLSHFTSPTPAEKSQLRARLRIPPEAICVGSFHKDGAGWGEGLEPKWVKAPDVLLRSLRRLAERFPIFVLLTGPARGYVLAGLRESGIPHRHVFLRRYPDIAAYYRCLDLYLIPSREEGGPKALMECMATGVPLVSTRVGMCADVIRSGENGILVEVDDADGLARSAAELIESPSLRRAFAERGLNDVRQFDWPNVARQYYEKIYRPLLIADV